MDQANDRDGTKATAFRVGGRPDPVFLTQLIAARLGVPQQRRIRRAGPEEAAASYRARSGLARPMPPVFSDTIA